MAFKKRKKDFELKESEHPGRLSNLKAVYFEEFLQETVDLIRELVANQSKCLNDHLKQKSGVRKLSPAFAA